MVLKSFEQFINESHSMGANADPDRHIDPDNPSIYPEVDYIIINREGLSEQGKGHWQALAYNSDGRVLGSWDSSDGNFDKFSDLSKVIKDYFQRVNMMISRQREEIDLMKPEIYIEKEGELQYYGDIETI